MIVTLLEHNNCTTKAKQMTTPPTHTHTHYESNDKVRKVAKNMNQYNQVPHLTQDTTWESDNNTIKYHKEEPRDQLFPSRWLQGCNEHTRKHENHKT